MYSTVKTALLCGVNAALVHVEVDVAPGLPAFHMVGSLGGEVRESKDRVLAALKNAGFEIPPMCITVNLSPADKRKEGTAFDLPIAIGLLAALGYFPAESLQEILFLGELGLNGEIRGVRGVLPIVQEANRIGVKECIVPRDNAKEGAVIPDMIVRGVGDITELLVFLQAVTEDREEILPREKVENILPDENYLAVDMNFSQVRGQQMAKRAAQIAAAGFHNLLMTGPPGAGKSMIAKRIPYIMPPLTLKESLEVTSVYSVAGLLSGRGLVAERPFQSPHHTIPVTALTGGGVIPKPGIMSLAHRGVLFLDELTEFSRVVLDSMRQPLEERSVRIARVNGNMVYPADFMLVCAMNPCPCGYYPDRNKCRCTLPQIKRYMGKVSGPLLDRIDLCVELQTVDVTMIKEPAEEMDSVKMRLGVRRARELQRERFLGTEIRFNADIPVEMLEQYCALSTEANACLEELYHKLDLSARSYHRIIRVARTIADLEGEREIKPAHIMEAACFRPSMEYWK